MRVRGSGLGLTLVAIVFSAAAAMAQTVVPAATTMPPPAAKAATAPRVKAGVAKAVPGETGRACTRLPLSDIQVGKEKTIEVARLRLDEYIAKVGKQRGWKTWDKSQETVSCEDYLNVPFLGQEYKCLVTATFCRKS